jgi:hypothetical protein
MNAGKLPPSPFPPPDIKYQSADPMGAAFPSSVFRIYGVRGFKLVLQSANERVRRKVQVTGSTEMTTDKVKCLYEVGLTAMSEIGVLSSF